MLELLVLAAVVLGLVAVANYRVDVPPVSPTPDYALQSAIAFGGIGIATVVAVAGTILIPRRAPVPTGRASGLAAVTLMTGGIAVLLAFVLSA